MPVGTGSGCRPAGRSVWRRRHWYGEGPLHLVLMLGSFALTGYAGVRLLAGAQWPMVVVWFVGAALLHDLVLLPLYALADRAVCRRHGGEGAAPRMDRVRPGPGGPVRAVVAGVAAVDRGLCGERRGGALRSSHRAVR